jgi:hypothetical protein
MERKAQFYEVRQRSALRVQLQDDCTSKFDARLHTFSCEVQQIVHKGKGVAVPPSKRTCVVLSGPDMRRG